MEPSSLIVFGFTGDLTKRKLLPSLYSLEKSGLLPDMFQVIGVTRKAVDMSELKDQLEEHIASCDREVLDKLCDRISLVKADISKREDFPKLKTQIDDLMPNTCSVKLFYFAVPPSLFEDVVNNMVEAQLHTCGNNIESRLLIEKPFGHDLVSAKKLLETIGSHFGEESIYPIDHYLAKDTAQNILYFRFHNPLIQNLWDGDNIKSIQVTAMEELDIQGRADFYEQTGALRDMIQGHMLQVLSLVTMDEPASLETDDVRRQRQLLLKSIVPIDADDQHNNAVRGQYKGYRNEVGNHDSNVETFAAVKLKIDTSRWRNVPVYLRAGKAMSGKLTEVNVIFKSSHKHDEENILTFRLQPNEGIAISFVIKQPGLENKHQSVTLDYCYKNHEEQLSEAYDRIIYDGIRGDQTLFPAADEILASWGVVQPLLSSWLSDSESLVSYPKGAASIKEADELVKKDNVEWVSHKSWVCAPRFNRSES